MDFWTPLWLATKHGVFTTLLNPSNSHCNGAIRIPADIRIWRDFGSALPFQTRLTQTKPVLPLANEHGSQVNDQGRRQCCHNKHKKFPYWPTRNVSLLSCASYTTVEVWSHISSLAVLTDFCLFPQSFHRLYPRTGCTYLLPHSLDTIQPIQLRN